MVGTKTLQACSGTYTDIATIHIQFALEDQVVRSGSEPHRAHGYFKYHVRSDGERCRSGVDAEGTGIVVYIGALGTDEIPKPCFEIAGIDRQRGSGSTSFSKGHVIEVPGTDTRDTRVGSSIECQVYYLIRGNIEINATEVGEVAPDDHAVDAVDGRIVIEDGTGIDGHVARYGQRVRTGGKELQDSRSALSDVQRGTAGGVVDGDRVTVADVDHIAGTWSGSGIGRVAIADSRPGGIDRPGSCLP